MILAFKVPASTTNLGHGFDCLGIALAAYNTVRVSEGDDGGAMVEAVRAACEAAWKKKLPKLRVQVDGEVPIARGLGSSATIRVAVAAACQRFAGRDPERSEVLEIAAEVEGHPDNVAAATLGGFTIVGQTSSGLRWSRFPAPKDMAAVVAIPGFEVKTEEARRILPDTLSRADHVRGVQRTAMIVAALAQNRPGDLKALFADAWHETHRAQLNPLLPRVRNAARIGGGIGTILSGSGSSILTFALREDAARVRDAMQAAATGAEVRVFDFDDKGLTAA